MTKYTKSAILAASACVLCLLTSCGGISKSAEPEKLSEDFSADAQITYDEREYAANFKRGGADLWECEFTAPETIKGLKLTATGELCKLEFMGLTYSLERSDVPEYGIMPLITSVVEDLIACRDLTCTSSEEGTKECGIVSGQDFTATVKDGKLISIQISDDLTAEFT